VSPLRLAPRSIAAAACALCLAITATPAGANGRYPSAQYVVRGHGLTVLRATWGLLVQRAPGGPFRWVCEESLGYSGDFDPSIAIDARGEVLVGLFDGLAQLNVRACGTSRIPGSEGLGIVDVDATRDGARLVALWSSGFVSSAEGVTGGLFRSRDGGARWERAPVTTRDVLWDTVEIDRADPDRLWFTGVRLRPRRVVFARSDDFGATIEEWPLDPGTIEGIESAYVAGSDDVDRDAVWVRAVRPLRRDDAGALRDGSDLLRSTDGGRRWTRVLRADAPLRGFALAPDGRLAFAGGPGLGLLRSLDAGASWTRLSSVEPTCLRWHEGSLLVCADAVRDGFTLAESVDRGDTLRPIATFCDVDGALSCEPAGATAVCAAAWPIQRVTLGCTTPPRPEPAMDAGPDAASLGDAASPAPRMDVTPSGDGGDTIDAAPGAPAANPRASCAIASGPTAPSPGAQCLLAGCAWLLRRRASSRTARRAKER
jgi:hypothetical protein